MTTPSAGSSRSAPPSSAPRTSVPRAAARVVGIVQGRDIDARATLELADDALLILWTHADPWRLALADIDGVTHGAMQMTLYLSSGDVLELRGDDTLPALAETLLDHACRVPELTRGLRALGSLRGAPGSAHDAWFAPLLSARRAIEGVGDPLRQLSLMDASQLSAATEKVIAALAVVRAPADAPHRRAIEAVLEEHAEPLFVALKRMALAADTLQRGRTDTRLSDWRRWVETMREVFAVSDECWGKAAKDIA